MTNVHAQRSRGWQHADKTRNDALDRIANALETHLPLLTHPGAPNPHPAAPHDHHDTTQQPDQPHPDTPTTRKTDTEGPVVPRLAERCSPAERREAWLALAAGLESQLGATMVHARAEVSMGAESSAWAATEWAASRLLAQVRDLAVPVVPVDPEPGQGTLADVVDSSTGVDEPVEGD